MGWYFVKRILSFGLWRGRCPAVPAIQWFADPHRDFEIRGRVEISLFPHLAMSFAVKPCPGVESWSAVQTMRFADTNMQLVGASGASGTMRMDFDASDANVVDVHTCADRNTTSLVRYNIAPSSSSSSGKEFKELVVLAHDPRCDLEGFLTHPRTGAVQAFSTNYEKSEMTVVDPSVAGDIIFLKDALPGCKVTVASRTAKDDAWVVFSTGDTRPGDYYLFDRQARALQHLCALRPSLTEGSRLAHMRPVHVRARDGEDLLCYLSLPPDEGEREAEEEEEGSGGDGAVREREKGKGKGRLVLMIHGGPSARDHWGFDPQVQLLCSRGISVLQVNYRGSTGLGLRFLKLPYGCIETMQQDIADCARWAVAEGFADRDKVGILGASWGGYETLCGLAFEPDLFACGVAIVPPSTVGAADTDTSFRGDPLIKMYWQSVLGAAASDQRRARELSPLFHVDKIQRPLMLIHGDVDTRVPREHSDRIVEALQARGGRGAYVTYADEGHGVKKERNVLDMWRRVERFLCLCLALPPPPALGGEWTEGHSATVRWDSIEGAGGGGRGV